VVVSGGAAGGSPHWMDGETTPGRWPCRQGRRRRDVVTLASAGARAGAAGRVGTGCRAPGGPPAPPLAHSPHTRTRADCGRPTHGPRGRTARTRRSTPDPACGAGLGRRWRVRRGRGVVPPPASPHRRIARQAADVNPHCAGWCGRRGGHCSHAPAPPLRHSLVASPGVRAATLSSVSRSGPLSGAHNYRGSRQSRLGSQTGPNRRSAGVRSRALLNALARHGSCRPR
jgi:hypothetical protein